MNSSFRWFISSGHLSDVLSDIFKMELLINSKNNLIWKFRHRIYAKFDRFVFHELTSNCHEFQSYCFRMKTKDFKGTPYHYIRYIIILYFPSHRCRPLTGFLTELSTDWGSKTQITGSWGQSYRKLRSIWSISVRYWKLSSWKWPMIDLQQPTIGPNRFWPFENDRCMKFISYESYHEDRKS